MAVSVKLEMNSKNKKENRRKNMTLFEKRKNESNTINPEIAAFEKNLAELAKKKQELIFQIGLQYVEKNTVETVAGTEFEPMLQQIDQMEKEKIVLNKRILAVQGLRKCESCENVLPLDSAFCNKCGEKLKPLFETEEVSKNICSKCGATLADGAAFCTACGTKVEE